MTNLKKQRIWINWRYENDPNGRQTKIPINSKTGGKAQSNNPQTWTDFNTAERQTAKFSGVGLMFADGLCGIDVDGYNGHRSENSLQTEIIDLFSGTYIETSPSGNGVHILFMCDLSRIPTVTDKDGKQKLDPKYYLKNPHNQVECYFAGLTNRYFTFTGNCISNGVEITDQTEQVLYFLNRYMLKQNKPPVKREQPTVKPRATDTPSLDFMRQAKNGAKFIALYDRGDLTAYNSDPSSADLALCNMLAFYLQGDEIAIVAANEMSVTTMRCYGIVKIIHFCNLQV